MRLRRWLVIVAGAPGTGKTTLSSALREKLGGFHFEIGTLREIHLNPTWSNASRSEEAMTFRNFVYMLKGYRSLGMGPVIVTDLQDNRIRDLCCLFSPQERLLVTLVLADPQVHKRRILDPKADRGFRRYDAAWAWDAKVKARKPVSGELRLETDRMDLKEELKRVRKAFQGRVATAGKIPPARQYFNLEAYFSANPTAPWNKKPGRHLNECWQKAAGN